MPDCSLTFRMPVWGVLLAGGIVIIAGGLFYPKSDLVSPMLAAAPAGGQMLWSFGLALVVSSAITAAAILFRKVAADGEGYDFSGLQSQVQLIDEPAAAYD